MDDRHGCQLDRLCGVGEDNPRAKQIARSFDRVWKHLLRLGVLGTMAESSYHGFSCTKVVQLLHQSVQVARVAAPSTQQRA